MSRIRSTKITLANNTDLTLTLLGSHLCWGDWTDDIEPPSQVPPKTHAVWESESGWVPIVGVPPTGTEGYVKYVIQSTDVDTTTGKQCLPELVYIYWNNPFFWDSAWRDEWKKDPKNVSKQIINSEVSTADVEARCDGDEVLWDTDFPHGGNSSPNCRHQIFNVKLSEKHIGASPEWAYVVFMPLEFLGMLMLGEHDINLEWTIGLRDLGSVEQSIHSFHDGSKGLRTLIRKHNQSSLRKFFQM
jgi:hypothetical protein